MVPPSGRQVEIHHARQRAIVVEVGGGLREYEVDGQAVLDGYALQHMADGGRGQALLPWPNRLRDGQYVFGGQELQLPIDEPGRHNALHGLTRWLNWSFVSVHSGTARVEHTIYPRPGYPFTLQLSIEYSLAADGLTVRTVAHNFGDMPLPFGAGSHPYFTVGTTLVDSTVLGSLRPGGTWLAALVGQDTASVPLTTVPALAAGARFAVSSPDTPGGR